MKTRAAALLIPVLLALLAGTAMAKPAPKKQAKADQHFGTHGSTVIATPAEAEGPQGFGMAVAPSNKSYVLKGSWLLAFGADGRPDKTFAGKGRLQVVPGPGKVVETAGVAVDSQGRVLVTGTYEPRPGHGDPVNPGKGAPGPPVHPDPPPSGLEPVTEAFVIRYLPNGSPDPSFGTGGLVLTNFGLPRPTGYPYGEESRVEHEWPIITSGQIRVDAQDRPMVTGTYYYALGVCGEFNRFTHSFIGRLTAAGAVDPSFGGTGYVTAPGETGIELVAGPGNGWVGYARNPGGCTPHSEPSATMSEWSETGVPSTSFAAFAGRHRPRPVMTVDPQGRILTYEDRNAESLPADQVQQKVTRLLPSGAVDTSFGFGGGIVLNPIGVKEIDGLAVDAKERTIVAFGSQQPELARLLTNGKVDKGFAGGSVARGEIGKGATAETTAVAIDSTGRILVAGSAAGGSLKTGIGVAITRFLPGN